MDAPLRFQWSIPERFNIGTDVVDRHADAGVAPALIEVDPSGKVVELGFAAVRDLANRLANVLVGHGLRRGDRVAILLPQRKETAIAHVAVYKAGLVAVPLFKLFGEEALEFRLQDSGARAIVTDRDELPKIERLRQRLPELRLVLCADGPGEGAVDLPSALERASSRFDPAPTAAEDPAIIIYTSGTTGQPKGALHAHRVLLGHLPGIEMPHDFFPQPGDRFWTPADWAWAGGLLDCLLPSLHHGVPVVARRFEKFDPEEAFGLLARTQVRNAFIPPTALRMLRSAPSPRGRHDIRLRTLGSGGEALGAETYEWGRDAFGLVINEFYGQTECNLVLASCAMIGVSKPGAIGKPVPGHTVAVIRPDGSRADAGEL